MRFMVAVAVMWLSGCSFIFVSGPPTNHEQLPYFSCSESRAAPVVDTILAALQALNLATAASVSDQQWSDNFNGDPPFSRGAAVPLYVGTTLFTAASAYYGYKNTGDCREAKAAASNRAMQNQPYAPPGSRPSYSPPSYPQPYTPPGASPYAPPSAPYPPPVGPYPPTPSPYAPPSAPSPLPAAPS